MLANVNHIFVTDVNLDQSANKVEKLNNLRLQLRNWALHTKILVFNVMRNNINNITAAFTVVHH